jgi:tetratricopeptide (TPR) repeat protein
VIDGTGPASAAASAAVLAEEPAAETRFWLGAFAAVRERWVDAEAQLAALTAPDSAGDAAAAFGAADRQALAKALRGFVALRRGEYERARRLMEESLPGLSVDANAFARYELGKLALELGDPPAAKRYLDSLALRTQARISLFAQVEYYLGVTHEALGQPDQALTHYGRFVNWWENADPELQPWVDRGRAALERLTAEAS